MSWLSKLSGRDKGGSVTTAAAPKERPSAPPEEFAMGSFRIRPYDGDLIAKQQFDFRIAFQLNGDPVEFACHGMVVKMDDKVGLVARYQPPQPFYERKLIEYLRAWKGL